MGGICTNHPIVKNENASNKSPTKIIPESHESSIYSTNLRKKSSKFQIICKTDKGDNIYYNANEKLKKLRMDEIRRSASNPNSPEWFNSNFDYEFIKGECIGKGKLGTVYSGLSLNTGEIVAIKSINLKEQLNKEKQIFDINEAVINIGELCHKNIIKYICTQPSMNPSEIDVICEFCNGGSIKQLLEKFDSFEEKLIRLYVKQILEGLIYLHDKNIVHRNIKNCNILIDGNGTVKLSDFVVSNILMGDDPETILNFNTNNGVDPPYYMAPEMFNKELNLTNKIDIWCIGCIIIEMATKNPPWSNISTNCEQVIQLIAYSKAPPKFPSHVSKSLKAFLTCCLQREPKRRPSAKELLNHKFFEIKQELVNSNLGNVIDLNTQTNTGKQDNKEGEINIMSIAPKAPSLSKLVRTKKDIIKFGSKKLIKNKNIQIVDKEIKKEEKDQNLINIIENESGAGMNFSVSMTVYSQQSILPGLTDMLNSLKDFKDSNFFKDVKEIKIGHSYRNQENDKITEAVYDQEFSPLTKTNLINSNNLFTFKKSNTNNKIASDIGNESTDSIQKIIDNYNLNDFDFGRIDHVDRLSTLEINKDDLQKLEMFFKERNNKNSIEPIEQSVFQNYIKNNKFT